MLDYFCGKSGFRSILFREVLLRFVLNDFIVV